MRPTTVALLGFLLAALVADPRPIAADPAPDPAPDPGLQSRHAAAARDPQRCAELAADDDRTACLAGVKAAREWTYTDACRTPYRRGLVFICNAAHRRSPGTCRKLDHVRMPYHAALCRALTTGDGEACQRAGTPVEQAACRAQAATIATVARRVAMPRNLALDPRLAWLTLPRLNAAACDRWRAPQ